MKAEIDWAMVWVMVLGGLAGILTQIAAYLVIINA